MVQRLYDMPEGTLGFRLPGHITRDEYFFSARSAHGWRRAASERQVSFLVVTGPDFHGLDLAALWEDMKAGGSVGLKHYIEDKDGRFDWAQPDEERTLQVAGHPTADVGS